MADVADATKVEEETTPVVKEVTKEVPVVDAVVAEDKAEAAKAEDNEAVAKEGENGSAKEEVATNGSSANGNGSTNGTVESAETDAVELDDKEIEEIRNKRKSESVPEVADATDGVSAEKKAKLEEKSEEAVAAADVIEAPANGEAEVTA